MYGAGAKSHGLDEDLSVCKDVTINDKTGHIVQAFISSKGKSISGLGQEQMAWNVMITKSWRKNCLITKSIMPPTIAWALV